MITQRSSRSRYGDRFTATLGCIIWSKTLPLHCAVLASRSIGEPLRLPPLAPSASTPSPAACTCDVARIAPMGPPLSKSLTRCLPASARRTKVRWDYFKQSLSKCRTRAKSELQVAPLLYRELQAWKPRKALMVAERGMKRDLCHARMA
jgi:hypothetical protein